MSKGPVKSFEDLEVWQLGKQLSVLAYKITENFPEREIYGITNQIRRAAISVPANIAEGFGRYHYMDRIKFFLNARGSLNELKSHLLISQELGFATAPILTDVFPLIESLSVKLNNFIASTRRSKD